MNWPGMGDPTKRKKTLKFLAISAIIAISIGAISSIIQAQFSQNDPLKVCINDKNTPYKIKASLELIIDGQKTDIPANIGLNDGNCQRTMYTLTDDGTIYAEWEEEYPFEIGHFLWMWDFPLRDMDQDKSIMYVNDKESPHFINHPLQEGYQYKGVFTSKAYDESKDSDFLPPEN
ncbi:MAG: hypothetical protein OEM77_02310 [Nitrosopumilus sp.]|nr:hypothetical protein [Nitrosopumilus sp.]MDH3736961.1 hypothetical protein [Nitrosopumilus sp.]MDH3823955.1 hypothetical protein [Nitrosopumilus sp.]MDH3834019.1 hypothetical protein [Nitrosopumilus sp.]